VGSTPTAAHGAASKAAAAAMAAASGVLTRILCDPTQVCLVNVCDESPPFRACAKGAEIEIGDPCK
jgi:hypothetical protein